MKNIWKKRIPAFLMSAILLVGTMPFAAAEDHNYSEDWSHDGTSHWHACTDPECTAKNDYEDHQFDKVVTTQEPTCYQKGSGTKTCTVCDYETTVEIPATGAHSESDEWSFDTTKHWHACTAAEGCPEKLSAASHSFTSGSYVTDANYHWQICTICNGSSAKSSHVDKDSDGVCDVCQRGGMPAASEVTVTFKNGSSTYETQKVTKGKSPSKPSTPSKSASNTTYTFKGWTTSNPGSSAVYTGQSCYSSSEVASRTLSSDTTYYAVYTVKATNKSGSFSVSGSSSGTSVGSSLRSQINNAFSGVTGNSFSSVKFTSLSSSSYGRLYTSSSKNTSVSTSSSSSYSYSNVSSFYFVPGSKSSFSISYTASDSYGNTVSGTVTLSVGSSSSSTTITYEVSPGDEVAFDRSDFNDVFQTEYDDYSVRYVTFDAPSGYDSADGAIYYDYDGSDEKSFSRSTLDNYEFYYSSSSYGDYALNGLSFVAGDDFDDTIKISFRAYYSSSRYVDGTLVIESDGSSSSSTTITYEVAPGDEVSFDRSDFNDAFQTEYDDYSVRYVTFDAPSAYDSADGSIYYDYGYSDEKEFSRSTLDNYEFYYSDSDDGDYALRDLSFVAGDDFDDTLKISFRAYYSSSRYVDGTLVIKPDGETSKTSITYEVAPGDEVSFDRSDFNDVFQEEYDDYSVRYVTFEAPSAYASADGTLYYDYDGSDEKSFSRSSLEDYTFYYSDKDYGDYALNDLSFVAGDDFDEGFTLEFRAYYSSSRYVDGTVRITPSGSTSQGNIFYSTTYNTSVQINPNDIARYFASKYPNYQLQYVELDGVPSTGTLYYNYYSTSKYGTNKLKLTSSNCDDNKLYFSPSSTSQYSLSELTYVPSGVNYCASIPFTAYSSGSRSVKGTILISVNFSAVAEVYGVTPKGSSVNFPASAIYTAVASSTSTALSSIQLLDLPASSVGTVYVGSGTGTKANTSTKYTYASGSRSISQLRFVPASGFTGSVEIPYAAYSSTGKVIATGKFCLGVVSTMRKFTDMTSSTWCYKYVTELSDAKVIDGYTDGTFRPNNTVTYGQALKLIMLAAGYSAQPQTGSHPFSGYLSRAQKDGLVSGNVNLDAPITRLAVAQIAAKAMKLSTSDLSSVKPFTDTSDPYVQALNAAGIVEGYFSNGTSTYKPNNTLTRGQISAIVWRMERSQ